MASIEAFWSGYSFVAWLGGFAVKEAALLFLVLGLFDLFMALGEREYAFSALRRGMVFVVAVFLADLPSVIRSIMWYAGAVLAQNVSSVEAVFKAIPIYARVVAIVALVAFLHLLHRASRELAAPAQDEGP